MISGKRIIGTGIIASIFTGTVSTILSAIILQWFDHPSSGNQKDKPPVIENKPTPPKVDPLPLPAPRDPAPRDPVPPVKPPAMQPLLDQLDAQKEKIDALKRMIDERKREAENRKDSEPNRPLRLVAPQPAPVLLYYRVASQPTKQVEYACIDEIKHFLKSMNLSYVCGRPWKDSGLSSRRVPIAIHKTESWRSYAAKSVAHRDGIMSKMLALGIETRIEKPEELDD